PGKEGEKPNVLIRRSQDLPKGIEDSRTQHQFQTVLQPHQLDKNVRKALAATFLADSDDDEVTSDEDDEVEDVVDANNVVIDEVDEEDIVNLEEYLINLAPTHRPPTHRPPTHRPTSEAENS
ncbi:hypothetical protein MMC07_009767, partial [Pseudocyphellaria aurata]|nr:hypothetical protein [Pseudocyphellaria aurata]